MTTKQFLTFISISIIVIVVIFTGIMYIKKETPNGQPLAAPIEKEELTIVAFGDSLTAGYGVDLSESYPYLLEKRLREEKLNVKVINMGVSGETTQGGVDRASFVLEQNPDVVLLGLGANDMLRSLPPALVKANLDSIIKTLIDADKKIVLLGMKSSITNGGAYRQEFDVIYKDLSEKYKLTLVPFFLEGVALRPSLNTSDGIHPNKAGYEKIVDENIIPILLPYLKKL
jgi:acyl-CoA thioesterase-1